MFRTADRNHRVYRAAVVAALLVLPLAACGSTSNSVTTPTGTTAVSSAAAAPAPAGSKIVINNFAFSPATLTVSPGQQVTVQNSDSTTHTVTATAGKIFDTGSVAAGASATFTAPTAPGSYPYICTIHQFMHGTLVVK